MRLSFLSLSFAWSIASVLCDPTISTFPGSLSLSASFDPIKGAYWTYLPHHRRTPFSLSPDGKSAYLAYLDATYKNVVVQQVDVTTFAAVGTAVSIPAFEAAGLVAQNDGFALFATVTATGTTDLPTNNFPIATIIRYKNGAEAWRTALNGPGVHPTDGLTSTPDANGDLVYSAASGLYGAYFVVTAYTGWAAGHYGDSVQYVNDQGVRQDIPSSSTFGCSHNTGIAIEAADAPPFATVCAEDQGSIWLNTDTRYMSGVKIANENTTNGVSGEPMGGMSGSYSNLALFPSTTKYVFAWQSRGALDLTLNAWLGSPYTQSSPRWLNHNVAIATMSSKNTLTGSQASSVLGAAEGDTQVNWITKSATDDHQNVRVATLNSNLALVSWETLTNPTCQPVPMSCSGTYAGTSFQFVDSAGAKVGAVVTSSTAFVSGDMVTFADKICWPYVDITWNLNAQKTSGTPVTKMSFACASNGNAALTGNSAVVSSSSSSPVSTSSAAASSTAKPASNGAAAPIAAAADASSQRVPSFFSTIATPDPATTAAAPDASSGVVSSVPAAITAAPPTTLVTSTQKTKKSKSTKSKKAKSTASSTPTAAQAVVVPTAETVAASPATAGARHANAGPGRLSFRDLVSWLAARVEQMRGN